MRVIYHRLCCAQCICLAGSCCIVAQNHAQDVRDLFDSCFETLSIAKLLKIGTVRIDSSHQFSPKCVFIMELPLIGNSFREHQLMSLSSSSVKIDLLWTDSSMNREHEASDKSKFLELRKV